MAAAKAKFKPDIRFTISTERDTWSGSMDYSVTLHAVVMGVEGEWQGKVLNPGHSYWDDPNYPANILSDFVITALHSKGEEPYWFGWQYRFRQPYEVDEKRAAEMLKLLRDVRRKMEKFERELGRPESFEAFALRVARAVGATVDNPFGFRDEARSYDGTGYRWHDASGLKHTLDRTVSGDLAPTMKGRY